ncbi:MAG: TIGR00153 family protein [Candidatus Thiodiazotropha sp. (ex Lucinoma annulata)]|nr:TIGR00153 family protein [Candidatus Thiodiazotropha sp. (ex Lucinoma borealis)]MCU7838394.1 TIGR00153 family protein [Candidatus Thiodiazotropha sp. (ex Troendleina suluensis)]MCU7883661.1 TIGR00153 family protein [Candidatus Thiodiazotropha sp. (ex Lucinoma annulata)]MCU7947091.1 TIGR00153 family protein [Candidatus Thiodiazotropha sp. (ex Cardiolucina cf. quadrata)]MCU7856807.1 TIGR00153 family protein [Candidatus Thiodiazotropha sp. (ex Lucinoma borealis)]
MRPSNPIASLLGSSPFKPLQVHMGIVKECIAEVPGLFEALIAGNQEQLKAAKEKIFSLEHDADQIENDIRARLPKSLFMPVDRRDLLELLEMQDSIADTAQDIAGLMMERDMSVPKDMNEPLQAFVQRCVDTCNQAASIIEELDELIEMGFKGNQANKVEEMVEVLGKVEDETDDMGMALARSLFAQEESMNPVSVMFWYQMIQWIGDLADYAEKVGDRMRLLIAR